MDKMDEKSEKVLEIKNVDLEEAIQIIEDIVGASYDVYNEYYEGLLESAYEAALEYELQARGHQVYRQVLLPIFYKGIRLNQTYRMDLVVDQCVIVELKAIKFVGNNGRRQLRHYMHLTHMPYGMIVNFSPDGVYSERRKYNPATKDCIKF